MSGPDSEAGLVAAVPLFLDTVGTVDGLEWIFRVVT